MMIASSPAGCFSPFCFYSRSFFEFLYVPLVTVHLNIKHMLTICQGTETSEHLLNGTDEGLDPAKLLNVECELLERMWKTKLQQWSIPLRLYSTPETVGWMFQRDMTSWFTKKFIYQSWKIFVHLKFVLNLAVSLITPNNVMMIYLAYA